MSKRPSLTASMKAVAKPPLPPVVTAGAIEPEATPKGEKRGYQAATREGKSRVTTPLSPADHYRLKRLALDQSSTRGQRTTIENLMAEALGDLFAKYEA